MKLSISLPDDLVAIIDEARGDVPRSVWIKRAIEQRAEIADAVKKTRGLAETIKRSQQEREAGDGA